MLDVLGRAALCVLSLGGCTAPLIEGSVDKFHQGNRQATALIAAETAAVITTGRIGPIIDTAFMPPAPQLKVVTTPGFFAEYVCLQSIQFAGLSGTQDTLNKLKLERDQKPAVVQDAATAVRAEVEACTDEVSRYLRLRFIDLPGVDYVPTPPGGAGAAPAVVLIAKLVIGLGSAGVAGIKAIWDGVAAELKAAEVKEVVGRADTQVRVRTALAALSTPENKPYGKLAAFCTKEANKPVCDRLKAGGGGPLEEKGLQYEITGEPDDRSPVCPRTVIKTDRASDASPASKYTLMNTATVLRRWTAARLAWARFKEFTAAQKGPVSTFEVRRRALDLAVADYKAIPSGEDIVTEQRNAWASLTALSCGKLSLSQTQEAFTAFVSKMTAITDSVDKGNTALETYRKDASGD